MYIESPWKMERGRNSPREWDGTMRQLRTPAPGSSTDTRRRCNLRRPGGTRRERRLDDSPRLESQAQPVTAEFTPVTLHDGSVIPARLFKPDHFDPRRKYPVIVYAAAGPRERVVANAWGGWQMAWNRHMARRGYVVLAVDPRGSGGYGHLFEEYVHSLLCAQETADIGEAVEQLKAWEFVDSHRVGIWGYGYGASVVVHAMEESPHSFKAAFSDEAIIDLRKYDAYFVERYLGLPSEHPYAYFGSMAVKNIRRILGSLLLAESSQDVLVRPAQAEILRNAFDRAKKRHPDIDGRVHLLTMDDAKHQTKADELQALFSAMTIFFDEAMSLNAN